MNKAPWLSLAAGLGLAACAGPTPGPAPVASAPGSNDAATAAPEPRTLAELLAAVETAYRKGDYDRGLFFVKRVFELKQADVTAFDRLGSIYYLLGRYGEALTIWQRALPLEKNLARRRELSKSIVVARRTLGLAVADNPPPAAAPRPRPRPPGAKRAPDRRELDRLYRSGVKHYARGEYLQATMAFLRIIELEPGNAAAAKALERLHLDGAAPAAGP